MDVEADDHFVSSDDSDEELQELYAAGILKPGLNEFVDRKSIKKTFVNNIKELENKLDVFKNNEKWIERMDIVSEPAPIAPEMALQIEEQEKRAEIIGASQTYKGQLDEFKRESLFHRQAQATVLEGLRRLKMLNLPTKRPEDYFAEMAKTDVHMQKVRANLLKKQAVTARIEKVRSVREQRKTSKKVQAEARLKKQNEKKEMLDEVKKFRKGIRKDLDFLENKKDGPNNKKPNGNAKAKSKMRRDFRDKKFGYGGRKRGSKHNTRDSTFENERQQRNHKNNPRSGGRGPKAPTNKRAGKNVRKKNANKRRR